MVCGQNICRDIDQVLELGVGRFEDWGVEAEGDHAVGEGVLDPAVIEEELHLALDLGEDVPDAEDLLEGEVLPLQDFGQTEVGQAIQEMLLR
jgi:hypothetical protein